MGVRLVGQLFWEGDLGWAGGEGKAQPCRAQGQEGLGAWDLQGQGPRPKPSKVLKMQTLLLPREQQTGGPEVGLGGPTFTSSSKGGECTRSRNHTGRPWARMGEGMGCESPLNGSGRSGGGSTSPHILQVEVGWGGGSRRGPRARG